MSFSIHFSDDKKPAQKKTAPFHIPSYLKVCCQKAAACNSSSKRKRGFVCGSNFSHDDRMQSCVEYCRLCRGKAQGERGGHPL
jgi:hypothetical protein